MTPVRRPLVYVAGPITKPNPMQNTVIACKVGDDLLDSGLVIPYLPHLSVLWEMVSPHHDYEDWMALDFGVIDNCHALYRMPGESPGADREVVYAGELGIPVFRNTDTLYAWAKTWAKELMTGA